MLSFSEQKFYGNLFAEIVPNIVCTIAVLSASYSLNILAVEADVSVLREVRTEISERKNSFCCDRILALNLHNLDIMTVF